MPIFPGAVSHNNTDSPILDLTKNQVIGMGIFPSVTGVGGRDALHVNLQTDGYIATILDISETHVYTGGTWADSNNWASVGGTGIPSGGSINDVLTRTDATSANWVGTITSRKLTVKNHEDNAGDSEIVFSRRDTIAGAYTSHGDVLGDIRAEGYNINGSLRTGGPSIRFTAVGEHPTSNQQASAIEFRVSNLSGVQTKALEIASDSKIILASIEDADIPTVVLGGMYYNSTQDNYFVGKVTPTPGQFD